ncbi:aldehyde dehydrogenase family protein [Staphylococcus sp. Mo2-7]
MINIKDYINGSFVERNMEDAIDVKNPATEETIAKLYRGSEQDTKEAIDYADKAQTKWSELPDN